MTEARALARPIDLRPSEGRYRKDVDVIKILIRLPKAAINVNVVARVVGRRNNNRAKLGSTRRNVTRSVLCIPRAAVVIVRLDIKYTNLTHIQEVCCLFAVQVVDWLISPAEGDKDPIVPNGGNI